MTAGLSRRAPLPLRLALRELRGGLKGFYVFIACIALGVAAIAAVGSVSRALVDGIAREGTTILGGDLSVSVVHQEIAEEERAVLEGLGRVSQIATLRAMARTTDGAAQTLVELKAVDEAYPLYGTLAIAGGAPAALGPQDGRFGIVAEAGLAARLGLEIGDPLLIGSAPLVLTGLIESEPDRLSGGGIGWGPRAIISRAALDASGLLQPGSLVRWTYRVALPPPAGDSDLAAALTALETALPDAGWRVRTRADAAPRLAESIERFTMFLTLVGLTALIVGGVGVANAVSAHLDRQRETIATLKSLGAPGGLVFRTYLTQILLLALGAMAIGLALGAMAPWAVGGLLSAVLPVADAVPGLYPRELAAALAYGTLTALAFALWPLGRAREVPATALYREHVSGRSGRPRRAYVLALAGVVAGLVALAVVLAYVPWLALMLIAGTAAAFVVLRLVALGLMAAARRLARPKAIAARLAVAAIHRPGTVTPSVVLSLGLGLTLLVTVAQIDGNLTRELARDLPDRAPSFFFLDIPRAEAERFAALLAAETEGGEIAEVPMLRGRITALKDVPAGEIEPPADAAWVLRGDRGLTYAETAPAGSEIVAGEWWPAGYEGPPLVSFEVELARELGLDVGDTIEVNVLGRQIRAEIANLRTVDWQSLSINFVMVFSPNAFAGAPHTVLATVTFPEGSDEAAELALMRAVTLAFPTVTSVRVKEALDAVNDLIRQLAWAVRSASGFTLVAGILVLAGALAASHRHRIHDAVVLKTLGATRRRLIAAYALEFGLLGTVTALFALAAGSLAAALVLIYVMQTSFTFLPGIGLGAVVLSVALTVGLGLAGTWRVLGQKPARYLRDL